MNNLKRLMPVLLLLLAQSAVAADATPVTLGVVAEREVVTVDADGNQVTTLERVTSAAPGETIVYTINYANDGAEPAENVTITDPVPPETAYIGGSAFGAGADLVASADGGLTYAAPAALRVPGADGELRPARPDEITHLRWTLRNPVAPGGRGFVRFKATVR